MKFKKKKKKEGVLVNPAAFFPSGKKPYPSQEDALAATADFLNSEGKRLMVQIIPTAGGKSPLAAAAAGAWIHAKRQSKDGGPAVILCINKALQSQYKKDFGNDELSVVMGASEFSCHQFKGLSCASQKAAKSCSSRRIDEYDDTLCPYQLHRLDASSMMHRKPMCFNPHSFFAFKKHPRFGASMPTRSGLLIVDEAHELPAQLREFLTLRVSLGLVEGFFEGDDELSESGYTFDFMQDFFLKSDPVITNGDQLRVGLVGSHQSTWLEALFELTGDRIKEIKKHINPLDLVWLTKNVSEVKTSSEDGYVTFLRQLEEIEEKLGKIIRFSKQSLWVAEFRVATDELGEQVELVIKPTTVPPEFLEEFFRGFDKIILMSGTIFKVHLQELGLLDASKDDPWEDVELFQCPSRIHPHKRKIYIDMINGRKVNYRNLNESFEHFARYIVDQVTPKVAGEKGIIHVSSHAQAELLARLGNSYAQSLARENGGRVAAKFISMKDLGWKRVFKKFVDAPRGESLPCVFLVAARRYEGIDLKDDLARVCIIAKAPFPHTKDTMIQALNAKFPGYTDTQTITSFIQAANRTTRTPEDGSLIIALDTNIYSIFERHGQQCPEYFQEQIEIPEYADWLTSWRSNWDDYEG